MMSLDPPVRVVERRSDLLDKLMVKPVVGPGTPAYRHARETMARNWELLKAVCENPGRAKLQHRDLPTLFAAALVDPRFAANLRGCTIEYEPALAPTWYELLDLHPLWCPAYLRFAKCFKGADAMLQLCGSDTLDHLIRLKCNPIRGVLLALLERDDAREVIATYAHGVRTIGISELINGTIKGSRPIDAAELAHGLAARALLFAVIGHEDAQDVAIRTVLDVLAEIEDVWPDQEERIACETHTFLHTGRCLQIWGLVHSLVDLGDLWQSHFALAAEARSTSSAASVPGDLAIPSFGGEAFAHLCGRYRDAAANWFATPTMPTSGTSDRAAEPADTCPAARRITSASTPSTFPTPEGTTWADVSIRFRDGHTVSVKAKDARGVFTYAQMGMVDRRNGNPTKQWDLLRAFAEGHGTMTWSHSKADRRNQKRRELLARDLRRFFGLHHDPITLSADGMGWITVFGVVSP